MFDDDTAGEIVGTAEMVILVEIDLDMVSVPVLLRVGVIVSDRVALCVGVFELDGDSSIVDVGVKDSGLFVTAAVGVIALLRLLLAEEVSELVAKTDKECVADEERDVWRVPVLESVGVKENDRDFVLVRVEVRELDNICCDIVPIAEGARVRDSDLVVEKLRDVVATAVAEVVTVSALDALPVPVDV